MIKASDIRPERRGRSDFYSWQLYRWLRSKPLYRQIWRGTWNSAIGIDRDRPVLYIGHMDTDTPGERWLHGRMLRNLCLHGQDIQSYAYGPGHDTAHWREITDEWWEEYMRIGVCAIHGDYAHAWRVAGDKRTCIRCGKVERSIQVSHRRTLWEGVIVPHH